MQWNEPMRKSPGTPGPAMVGLTENGSDCSGSRGSKPAESCEGGYISSASCRRSLTSTILEWTMKSCLFSVT